MTIELMREFIASSPSKSMLRRKIKKMGGRLRFKGHPWTMEEIKVIVSAYSSLKEFRVACRSLYNWLSSSGHAQAFAHLRNGRNQFIIKGILDPISVLSIASKYESLEDFRKLESWAYQIGTRRGLCFPEFFESKDDPTTIQKMVAEFYQEQQRRFVEQL